MITVKRWENGISIKGHAHYAPRGYDIVCAGVSTLAQTLIQSFEELTSDKIEYVMSSGTIDVKFGNLSTCAQTLVDSFFVGAQMIADEYPEYVQIV